MIVAVVFGVDAVAAMGLLVLMSWLRLWPLCFVLANLVLVFNFAVLRRIPLLIWLMLLHNLLVGVALAALIVLSDTRPRRSVAASS